MNKEEKFFAMTCPQCKKSVQASQMPSPSDTSKKKNLNAGLSYHTYKCSECGKTWSINTGGSFNVF